MKKKNFAVFGLGRFGRNVALTLEELGYNVLGVDKDETVVAEMAQSLTKVVSFDIRDAYALNESDVSSFDVVIIASKSLEASLMATMLCKAARQNGRATGRDGNNFLRAGHGTATGASIGFAKLVRP